MYNIFLSWVEPLFWACAYDAISLDFSQVTIFLLSYQLDTIFGGLRTHSLIKFISWNSPIGKEEMSGVFLSKAKAKPSFEEKGSTLFIAAS